MFSRQDSELNFGDAQVKPSCRCMENQKPAKEKKTKRNIRRSMIFDPKKLPKLKTWPHLAHSYTHTHTLKIQQLPLLYLPFYNAIHYTYTIHNMYDVCFWCTCTYTHLQMINWTDWLVFFSPQPQILNSQLHVFRL